MEIKNTISFDEFNAVVTKVTNGIRDFNATNKLGLHIDVERIGNGKYSIESY